MQDIVQELDESTDRVREHSANHVNRRIALTTQASAAHSIREGRDAVSYRLSELDREWDIDRVLMANFAIVGGAAYALGLQRYSDSSPFRPRGKGLLALVGVQMGFLLLHAAVGWCPPVALWRRLGYRTKAEIDVERRALRDALEQFKRVEDGHRLPAKAARDASKS